VNEPLVPEHLRLLKQPKQKRTELLIDKIMNSTIALIQEHGFQSVNTNAIAAHAQISVKSLYLFFPNKESILYYIADTWLKSLRDIGADFEEGERLNLTWKEYFLALNKAIFRSENYLRISNSLNGMWEFLPEFGLLDEFQSTYIAAFYKRQLRRFGSKKTDEELDILCRFLISLEASVAMATQGLDERKVNKLWQIHFKNQCFNIESALN